MTKQEQIEEMRKEIENGFRKADCRQPYTNEPYPYFETQKTAIAEALYNAGYRKIPENAVVLTKEEYEDLKVAADNYDPFWFCSFGGCEGARKGCKDDCEMSIFVQERKKTAKEIISAMKTMIINRRADERSGLNSIYTTYSPERLFDDILDYVRIAMGVEVEQ